MGQTCSAPGPVLLRAAKQGELDTVRRCLKEDPNLAHHLDAQGRSALYFAARAGEVETLQLLTTAVVKGRPQRGPVGHGHRSSGPLSEARLHSQLLDYLNGLNEGGESALAAACRRGHTRAVTFLLAQGADPCQRDLHRKATCLHLAVLSGSTDCVEVLFKHTIPGGSPHSGVSASMSDLVDLHDSHGYTPLLYASKYGYLEITKILLTAKASVNLAVRAREPRTASQPYNGCSALHLAAIFGHTEILRVLLEYIMVNLGCEVGTASSPFRLSWEGTPQDPRLCRNGRNETPFKCAVKHRHRHAATLLDPTIPLTWVVQGEAQKNHVPELASIAKTVLHDHHVQWLAQFIAELEFESARRKVGDEGSCLHDSASLKDRHDGHNVKDQRMHAEKCQKSAKSCFETVPSSTDSWALGCGDSIHGARTVSSSASESTSDCNEEYSSNFMETSTTPLPVEAGCCVMLPQNNLGCNEYPDNRSAASNSHFAAGKCGDWQSNLYDHLYDHEDQIDDEDALCGVCLDRPQQVLLRPCDHSLCAECAMAIVKHPSQGFTCPYCRKMFGALERIKDNIQKLESELH